MTPPHPPFKDEFCNKDFGTFPKLAIQIIVFHQDPSCGTGALLLLVISIGAKQPKIKTPVCTLK